MYQEALRQVAEHLEVGKPEKAIETFESYIFIGPTEKYENMAKEEIKKLRSKYGVLQVIRVWTANPPLRAGFSGHTIPTLCE